MKRTYLIIIPFILMALLTGCGSPADPDGSKITGAVNDAEQEVTWDELSANGVNEELFLENLEPDVLQDIAGQLQTLCNEIAEEQKNNPQSVLEGTWVDMVFASEQYKNIIAMGSKAQKPLYWIIYKSEHEGIYEWICASALEELSGYDFDEDGDGTKWASSKEFLEEFNLQVLKKK